MVVIVIIIALVAILYFITNKQLNSISEKYINKKKVCRHTSCTSDKFSYINTHTNFPFWNTQIGTKRGMIYDLRGMPNFFNPNYDNKIIPFGMSPKNLPIVNKSI